MSGLHQECCQAGSNCCQNRKDTSNNDIPSGKVQTDTEEAPNYAFSTGSANTLSTLSKDGLNKQPLPTDAVIPNGLSAAATSQNKLVKLGAEEKEQAGKTLPYDPSQEPIFPPFLKVS